MLRTSKWHGRALAGLGLLGACLAAVGAAFSSLPAALAGAACCVACAYGAAASLVRRLERLSESVHRAHLEIAGTGRTVAALLPRLDAASALAGRADRSLGALKSELATQAGALERRIDGVDRSVRHGRNQQARGQVAVVHELDAVLQARALLGVRGATPPFGGWAMDASALLWIVDAIARTRPRLVVECGSGTSTFWLSRALARSGGGRLVALEHSAEHRERTRRWLADHGLDDVGDVVPAPLVRVRVDRGDYDWYDLSGTTLAPRSIDLLLVDGPPGNTGPLARYPALPLLLPFLAEGALVILDDTSRKEEMQIAEAWRERYGLEEIHALGGAKGTMVFRFPVTAVGTDDAVIRGGGRAAVAVPG